MKVGDITIHDFIDKDGKLVSKVDSVKVVTGVDDMPPKEKAAEYEKVQQQLGEQLEASEGESEILKAQKRALENQLPPSAWANYGDDILRKHVPQIGIEDPAITRAQKEIMQIVERLPSADRLPFIRQAMQTPGLGKPVPRHITLADLRSDAEAQRSAPGKQDEWLARWHAAGFPTFELTGGLAAALSMTECKGLRGRDFQVPFPVFAVQMPRPSPLVLPGGDVRVLLVDGRTAAIALHGDDKVVQLLKPSLLPDDEHVEVWARQHDQPQVARFLVNLCAYINSVHAPAFAEQKHHAGGGKSHRKDSSPKRWVIGRDIKLSPGMLQAARAAVLGERTAKQRAEYRMHVRFMVRGHWRNQACGTKHAERKLRWIEPFWKGPEMAEGLARLYAVAEEPNL